jgi:hypothetical protein
MAHDLERLKQRIPLLEYLQRHNWKPCRAGTRQEFLGLCPLHQEVRPSFYVNVHKNLFYCHGCGQGGDLIPYGKKIHRTENTRGFPLPESGVTRTLRGDLGDVTFCYARLWTCPSGTTRARTISCCSRSLCLRQVREALLGGLLKYYSRAA